MADQRRASDVPAWFAAEYTDDYHADYGTWPTLSEVRQAWVVREGSES